MFNIKRNIFNFFKKKRQLYEKKIFKNMLEINDEISLIDIGGYKGIQDRWKKIEQFLDFHTFEPNPVEAKKISVNSKKFTVHTEALSDHDGEIFLNICKEPGVSSVLEPNKNFLKKFKNIDRYDIIKKLKVKCKKLDSLNINKIDFIKIDVQGYNLEVLKGSIESLKKCIGVEIECEFKQIYKNQSMFKDVENFLNNSNFELIDFVDIVRWCEDHKERNSLNIRGEIVFVNAFFLKKNIENYIDSLKNFKKILTILILFGQYEKVYKLIHIFEKKYELNNNFKKNIFKLSKSIKNIENYNKLFILVSKIFSSEFQTSILK